MATTVTRADLDQALAILNSRLELASANWRYKAQKRYGYIGLDVYDPDGTICLRGPVVTGTKREVCQYVSAMLEALDAVDY